MILMITKIYTTKKRLFRQALKLNEFIGED